MKITEVRVIPINEDKLKAYASIVLEDCFVVRDLKVIRGKAGLFVAMPAKMMKDGTYVDLAHPTNPDTRKMLQDAVLAAYLKRAGDEAVRRSPALRMLSSEA